MLSTMFQGLALPNPNIDMLRRKLHLVQREWGTDGIMGKLLNQVYQVFQVEVGLNGNIFDYSFEDYGDLATHGFFRNLWQLIRLYGVKFRIHATFDIPLLQEDNRTIMDSVTDTSIFSRGELVRLTRYWHHKKVHSLGDLTQCDGITVGPVMYSRNGGMSYREFPTQCLTKANHGIWLRAIGSLTLVNTNCIIHWANTLQNLIFWMSGSHWRTALRHTAKHLQECTRYISAKGGADKPGMGPVTFYTTLTLEHAHGWCGQAFETGMVRLCDSTQQHARQ